MDDTTRRTIAYIGGRLISGKRSSAIYDYSGGGYTSIDGSVTSSNVDVYDYGRSCHVSGSGGSLYDYGRGCHVDLKAKDATRFSGYDYGSSSYFEGTVSGASVSFYDYDTGSYSTTASEAPVGS